MSLQAVVCSIYVLIITVQPVVGDRNAGLTQLVTAVLDEPLASDGTVSVALASRRLHDAPEAIEIT